ncbi:hypothetical protein ACI6Q2_02735 [Chitinophagaceae bacterium LWZ2-11]
MAKIELSPEELHLVTNASFILTKNIIVQKVYTLFGELSESYRSLTDTYNIQAFEGALSPKISKGENYEGLPWVMLDQPRLFSNTNVLAIRTFFWWGNFFSITLQLSGESLNRYLPSLKALHKETAGNVWYLCYSEDAWQHHFRADNYKPLHTFGEDEIMGLKFIKLAQKIPIQQWGGVGLFLQKAYEDILQILQNAQ